VNKHKIGFFIASALATAAAAAAEPQAESAAAEPAELPLIVVTGSSIPTTPDAVAVPVETLTAAQL